MNEQEMIIIMPWDKIKADLDYVAMMADIDIPQEENNK